MRFADMKLHDYSQDQQLVLVEDDTGFRYVAKWRIRIELDRSLSFFDLMTAHILAAIRRDNAKDGVYILPYRAEDPTQWMRLGQIAKFMAKIHQDGQPSEPQQS